MTLPRRREMPGAISRDDRASSTDSPSRVGEPPRVGERRPPTRSRHEGTLAQFTFHNTFSFRNLHSPVSRRPHHGAFSPFSGVLDPRSNGHFPLLVRGTTDAIFSGFLSVPKPILTVIRVKRGKHKIPRGFRLCEPCP